MAKFELDRKAIAKAGNMAASARAQEIQKLLDDLRRRQAGRPVDEVKKALKREWRRCLGPGADISDPHLTGWATAIAEGTKIEVVASSTRARR